MGLENNYADVGRSSCWAQSYAMVLIQVQGCYQLMRWILREVVEQTTCHSDSRLANALTSCGDQQIVDLGEYP